MAVDRTSEAIELPLVIKPDLFAYFLGGALSFIFWLPLIVNIILGRWDWRLFVLAAGITSLMFALIHGCRITINEVGVKYTRLFFWSRFLPYNRMEKCGIETSIFPPKNRSSYSLVIKAQQNILTINIKLFSRNDLSNLMMVLFAKAPNAHFDKRCERMKEHFMPSLLGHETDEKELRSRSKILDFLLKER